MIGLFIYLSNCDEKMTPTITNPPIMNGIQHILKNIQNIIDLLPNSVTKQTNLSYVVRFLLLNPMSFHFTQVSKSMQSCSTGVSYGMILTLLPFANSFGTKSFFYNIVNVIFFLKTCRYFCLGFYGSQLFVYHCWATDAAKC